MAGGRIPQVPLLLIGQRLVYCLTVMTRWRWPSSRPSVEHRADLVRRRMKGTGSDTIVVENHFVPEHRVQRLSNMLSSNFLTPFKATGMAERCFQRRCSRHPRLPRRSA